MCQKIVRLVQRISAVDVQVKALLTEVRGNGMITKNRNLIKKRIHKN